MLERAHWEVVDYASLGTTHLSDPVRLDRDERAFCLLRSRYGRLANVELLDGWHDSEGTGWRWTARQFGVRVHGAGSARVIEMRVWIAEESIQRLGAITLSATVNGAELAPSVFDAPGLTIYSRRLAGAGGEVLDVRFRLDKVLLAEAADGRELGIIVERIAVE
jgi:hypothetical protein